MTDRTYDERHQAAVAVLEALQLGEIDGERAARMFHRRFGALGSYGIDVVMGDLWCRQTLSRRDRSLIVIPLLCAVASRDELLTHAQFGLNNGLSRAEIEEIILHVAVNLGFPQAFGAARVVDELFCRIDDVERQPERTAAAHLADATRAANSDAVLAQLDRSLETAVAYSSESVINVLGRMWELGEIWARPELTPRDRRLVTVALLAWLANQDELVWHLQAALCEGITADELREVCLHVAIYSGFPKGRSASSLLEKIIADKH